MNEHFVRWHDFDVAFPELSASAICRIVLGLRRKTKARQADSDLQKTLSGAERLHLYGTLAMRYSLLLIAASIACAFCVHAQIPEPSPAVGDALLHPEQITISGHFEATFGLTAIERGVEFIAGQIDAKRAADVARMHVSPIWDLAFWRYLPTDSSGTLNSPVMSEEDHFFTPDYLKVSSRQLDYELSKAERTSQELLR